MNECDDIDATVDGGDVLYTGFGSCDFFVILVQILSPARNIFFLFFFELKLRDELFVGISKRSTAKGADYLAKVFQIPVHHIAVEGNCSKLSQNTGVNQF